MNIAIIGCGWLGFPLAKHLLDKGHSITGTCRDEKGIEKLEKAGISAIVYNDETETKICLQEQSELVIICFPPSGSKNYALQIKHLISQFNTDCKFIFTSSSSVYAETSGLIIETSTLKENNSIIDAENVLLKFAKSNTVILRLAGLFGNGRHPINSLAGKKELPVGLAPVNLVHLNDVISAIDFIISNNSYNNIYNLCFPSHPSRQKYYSELASKRMQESPEFLNDGENGKIIDSDKIVRDLDFTFKWNLKAE